ncbi:putative peptidase s15 protein [Phaeoacremonium minimum UCRPA7]|uniref:Putative peptidase s15 protein n=1 Tax=Phaeoacremonium minimum (strain UCR-PA7) TaxID=1286976 RepID=R8BJQ3_PHAM7|nr:putative peptidase s15 protein [Phaeoacremonium minimum UCRPA7]EON99555.1 putative peptidase s15 protein [Phaeoacremonium minimum UCRPA7]
MPATAIQIPTSDGRVLAGTLYTPSLAPAPYGNEHKLPALVLAPTFTAIQGMGLQNWASHFTHHLWMAVVTFDARGFGASQGPGFVTHEALPTAQVADIQDAITYAAAHPLIDPSKIALWGSGLSGGHVLHVAAIDKRIRAVISQAPLVNGWETISRRVRYDHLPDLEVRFAADRLNRCTAVLGGADATALPSPAMVPVVTDPAGPAKDELCALPGADSFAHFGRFVNPITAEGTAVWANEVTLRSLEAIRGYMPATLVDKISPTPLLMVLAREDRVCPADLALATYEKALQPKEVRFVAGGHYSVYGGEQLEGNVEGQIAWLRTVFGL